MASQGVLVDQPTMVRAASDFEDTSTRIRGMMSSLEQELLGQIGSTQSFNGKYRMTFDACQRELQAAMGKAEEQLTIIGQCFRKVMNQHAALSDDQSVALNQVAAPLQSGGGSIVSGLNA